MKTAPNILRNTVDFFDKMGCEFYLSIPVSTGGMNKTAPVKISAIQLSKAVEYGNRQNEVVVDLQKGRNGRKSAYIIEIPNS